MRVLVVGSGGREDALCWKISQSPLLKKLWCAPGNPGTAQWAENVNISAISPRYLVEFCVLNKVDLVIPGPETSIVTGLADRLAEVGIPCCAPSKLASQLESSKEYTKILCDHVNIPTAKWQKFTNSEDAIAYIDMRETIASAKSPYPMVIKADGLAAGKGVVIAQTREHALKSIRDIMDWRIYGEAGISIVIEEFLQGTEASVFALSNGTDAVSLGSAQDYKKLYEPDGPNTGGMGAISPAPELNALVYEETWHSIILPTLAEMKNRGTPFKGILYAGIMIVDNMPKLIEFNVRFGDPECQAILMRLETDLLRLLYAAATGVSFPEIKFKDDTAITVVMAAPGYPKAPEIGAALHEPSVLQAHAQSGLNNMVFHAGTKIENNHLFTAGGRVLNVCAIGDDCRQNAYKVVEKINKFCFAETAVYRKDIGL